MSIVEKKAASTPATPPTGYVHWYVNSSGDPEYVDDSGALHTFVGPAGPLPTLTSADGSFVITGTNPFDFALGTLPQATFAEESEPAAPATSKGVLYDGGGWLRFKDPHARIAELGYGDSLDSTVSNSASTADLYGFQITIPANTAVVSALLEFEIFGLVSSTSGTGFGPFIMVNGTKYCIINHNLGAGTNTNRPWVYRGQLQFKSIGSAGTFMVNTKYESAASAGTAASTSTSNPTALGTTGATPITVNTTADIAFKIGAAHASTSGTATSIVSGRLTLHSTP